MFEYSVISRQPYETREHIVDADVNGTSIAVSETYFLIITVSYFTLIFTDIQNVMYILQKMQRICKGICVILSFLKR